jgi:4-diphosphocytidyl-2-C-methyl-D-erythritol kinase
MAIEKSSPCKVNLLLNILGKRPDGFHELETLMQPVQLHDLLTFEKTGAGLELTCSDPQLPTDSKNLVYRAAEMFVEATRVSTGVRIHLEKRIPLAAGLGGGSGNAATTLLGLNELFGAAVSFEGLRSMAARLGSDVPFFLQTQPALATGRGEEIAPLQPFPALSGGAFLLIHPGFGIATSWAYQSLGRFPSALNGSSGRAAALAQLLRTEPIERAGKAFYNSLEAPAFDKFPILSLFQDYLREKGAAAALMSGSGSTTFAIARSRTEAEALEEAFLGKFGKSYWTKVVPV